MSSVLLLHIHLRKPRVLTPLFSHKRQPVQQYNLLLGAVELATLEQNIAILLVFVNEKQ